MAIIRSAWPKGQKQLPVSGCAGTVVAVRFDVTLTEEVTTNDILEIGGLPIYHQLLDATLVFDAQGADVTGDVGFITGEYGDDEDGDRELSTDLLFDGAALDSTTAVRMSIPAAFLFPAATSNRGIGLVPSATIAAGQRISLIVYYAQ